MYKNKHCSSDKKKIFVPQKHQTFTAKYSADDYIKNFKTKKFKYRGLLLMHQLGSGKSCTAIETVNIIHKFFMEKKDLDDFPNVYVFSSAPLRQNFINEYCDVCGVDPKLLHDKFIFITYNYSKIDQKLEDLNLDNSIIIVDECHNIVGGKRNGSKTYSMIYDLINASKKSKVLLLSGTPFKKIEDIPLLINLMKPNTFEIVYHDREYQPGPFYELLETKPIEYKTELDSEIIKAEIRVPKDNSLFLKYFEGVISFFPGLGEENYPKRINEFIKINMSFPQSQKYFEAREWEANTFKPDEALKYKNLQEYKIKLGLWQVANKNLFSKSVSNFMYPETLKINNKEYNFDVKNSLLANIKSTDLEKHINKYTNTISLPDKIIKDGGWVDKRIFTDYKSKKLFNYYSSKFYTILENISKDFKGKHVIYSILKSRGGILLLNALLQTCGISTLIYSGDIKNDAERESILKKFNDPIKNLRGEKYKVILLTEAGIEGLTLKAVKGVHIVEGDKNESKVQQAIGRAIRYNSHADLPLDERYCIVYRYFGQPISENITKGIDELSYIKGIQNQIQKNVFVELFKQASI